MSSSIIISQKSSQQLQNKQDYTKIYQKFLNFHFHNHVFKKGIVFVGNSRIGKSTLSALFSGIKMRIKQYDSTIKVQPAELIHRQNQNLIRHTLTSVTQFPNIHSKTINGQQFTIVDLPGFRDTSYIKQLCNWYYTKSILQKMEDILFVMVIQIHNQRKQVKPKDIQMMQRFMQAFPSKVNGNAKQNLIVIINFVQLSAQSQTKPLLKQIKQKLFKQFRNIDSKHLKQQKMQEFYSKSFENDKVLFFQKASNKENSHSQLLKNGVEFNEPKLFQFINNNLNCIQKTDQSNYKLKNTRQNDKKGESLRIIIVQLAQSMQKSIKQNFQQLKNFFSHILNRLSQTKGITLYIQDMQILNNLSKQKKLEKLDGMHQKQQIISNRLKQILNPSELILKIISVFKVLTQNNIKKLKQEETFPVAIDFMKQNCHQFIILLLKLCSQVFDSKSFKEIQKIMNRIWKSICIQTRIWLFLNQSVQDFQKNLQQYADAYYFNKMNKHNLENLCRKMERIQNFSTELQGFLNNQVRLLGQISPKKVNLSFLQQIIQACQLVSTNQFKQLKTTALSLKYKFIHQIINHIDINIELNKFQDSLRKINSTWEQYDKKQSDFYKWTQDANNKQWGIIKLQSFLSILRFIKTTKQNPKTILELYTSINACHYQLFQYLKGLAVQNKYQKYSKQQIGQLFLDAGDYFKRQFKKIYAFECYQIAANICFPQFLQKCQQANQKSLNLNENDANMSQYKWKWGEISDDQFKKILSVAMKNVGKQKQPSPVRRFVSLQQRSSINLANDQLSPQNNNRFQTGQIRHAISQFQPASQNRIMHASQNRNNHMNNSQSQIYQNQRLVSPRSNNRKPMPPRQIKFRQFDV